MLSSIIYPARILSEYDAITPILMKSTKKSLETASDQNLGFTSHLKESASNNTVHPNTIMAHWLRNYLKGREEDRG